MLESAAGIFKISAGSYQSRSSYGGSSYSGGGQSSNRGYSAAGGELAGAYSSLGLTPDASDEDVKKSYRKKVAEFHPDKIAAKGLPAEFTQFATEKFQEIQASYEKIKKARSF